MNEIREIRAKLYTSEGDEYYLHRFDISDGKKQISIDYRSAAPDSKEHEAECLGIIRNESKDMGLLVQLDHDMCADHQVKYINIEV